MKEDVKDEHRIICLEISKSGLPSDVERLIKDEKFFSRENHFRLVEMIETNDSYFFRVELIKNFNSYQFGFNGKNWPSINYRLRLETKNYVKDFGLPYEDYLSDFSIKLNVKESYCICGRLKDCDYCLKENKEKFLITSSGYNFTFNRTIGY